MLSGGLASLAKPFRLAERFFPSSNFADGTLLCWVQLTGSSHHQDEDALAQSLQAIGDAIVALSTCTSIQQLKNTSPRRAGLGSSHSLASLLCYFRPAEALNGYDDDVKARLESVEELSDTISCRERCDKTSSDGPALSVSWGWYKQTQHVQGRQSGKVSSTCIISVVIEPGPGQGKDIDKWYRTEYLPILAKVPFFTRSRRFERLQISSSQIVDNTPKLLALNEYVSVKALFEHCLHNGPLVPKTDWSCQVFDNAKSSERVIWSAA